MPGISNIPLRWRHIVCNTKSSWLPGDERGFRSRGHRIHSSGDYKNRPPEHEHEGLRRFHQVRSSETIFLDQQLWPLIGRAFRDRLIKEGFKVVSMSAGAVHSHCLSELPDDRKLAKAIVGRCKRAACEAIKDIQPGTIWAAGGDLKLVSDQEHYENAYKYIFDQPHAWVWCERDGEAWNP